MLGKETNEVIVGFETLAASFEKAAEDGNLGILDLMEFIDDVDEIQAAADGADKIVAEIAAGNLSAEDAGKMFGRMYAVMIKIGKAAKKLKKA